MKYPNAFKGVKKIWIAEILMLIVAVLGIVSVFVIAANSVVIDDVLAIDAGAADAVGFITLSTAIIALIAFFLNLLGLIVAQQDEESFRTALYVTLVGVVTSVISAIWSTNVILVRWMDVITTLCNLFASYYVLTGIASLANTYPDTETRDLALKSRTWLMGTFCATAIMKIILSIFNIQSGTTFATILGIVGLVLEIVSYILYLRALNRGKNMLER